MEYILVVINKQGASEETRYQTKAAVRAAIRTWADPRNLTARVWTSEGEQIYDGTALGF